MRSWPHLLLLTVIPCATVKIGQHNGAHFYTIGQRKGLGIGGRKESLFVLATDVEQNVIYVGEGTTIRDFTAGPCGSLPASCTGSTRSGN